MARPAMSEEVEADVREMMREILAMKRLIERARVFIWVIAALAGISLLVWLGSVGYTQGWTGFQAYTDPNEDYYPAKTLWDWMELLIIPLVLAIGGFLLSRAERRAERASTNERNREITLQTYLDKMTELLLKERLADPEAPPIVRNIARARTVTTLRQLDPTRRNLVLGFLRQADLINKDDPVRLFAAAALHDADLFGAWLGGADLRGADLRQAWLADADLSGAWLSGTDLSGADLRRTQLSGAILTVTHYDDATQWPDGFTLPSGAFKFVMEIEDAE